MKVLFVNRPGSKLFFDSEVIYFYCLYLLSENVDFHSWLSKSVDAIKSNDKWSQQEVIENFFEIMPAESSPISKAEALRLLALSKELKKLIHKSKSDIVQLQRFANFITALKTDILTSVKIIHKQICTADLASLFDDNTIVNAGYSAFKSDEKNEDRLVDLLTSVMSEHEKFLVLGGDAGKRLNEMAVEQNIDTRLVSNPCFYSIPLATIPFSKKINSTQITTLRNRMQNKFRELSLQLDMFHAMISKEKFGEDTVEKVRSFSENIAPLKKSFQTEVDNENHFQKMMSVPEQCYNLQLKMCVACKSDIISYYERENIFSRTYSNLLREKLSSITDVNNCSVFLYIEIPEKALMNTDELNKGLEEKYEGWKRE